MLFSRDKPLGRGKKLESEFHPQKNRTHYIINNLLATEVDTSTNLEIKFR